MISLQLLPEVIADQQVRRKRHAPGQLTKGEKTNLAGIRSRFQFSPDPPYPKPYTDGLMIRIMKIGMNRKDRSDRHVQTGFLPVFPLERHANVFVPLHMTAGDTPTAGVRPCPSNQEQRRTFREHSRYTDCRIAVQDAIAAQAVQALSIPARLPLQPFAAVWAKPVIHSHVRLRE
jgi:hypothetical protein